MIRGFEMYVIKIAIDQGFEAIGSLRLGSQREVEQYLKHYASIDSKQFAVIKVGGGVLLDELDDFVESLSFLHNVGLCPIVIHGGGPQLNEELARQGIVSDYIEGIRVTSPDIIRIAQKIFAGANARLVQALETKGVRARPITSGIFKAEANDPKLGLVGEIVDVNTQPIYNAIDANCIPVLTCLGQSDFGQTLNINADIAAREIAKAIRPFKVVYISGKGGIVDQNGKIITNIDLRDDFTHLMQQPWFKHGDRLKLRQIKEILDSLPSSSSVAITSAKLLAEELFTHRGSGTLIRNYEKILDFDSSNLNNLDVDRLLQLVENAFNAKLSSDYWDSMKGKIQKIYVSAEYRATAIVTRLDDGMPGVTYLDKFAVNQQFRSDGLGNRIWKRMTTENPKLVWRSRSTNDINPWYFMQSQGSIKESSQWTIFWLGLSEFGDIQRAVDKVRSMPKKLYRKGEPGSAHLFATPTKIHVGIVGARGYTGSELIQLVSKHPEMELVLASSRSSAGKKVKDVVPGYDGDLHFLHLSEKDIATVNDVDIWVLALPNGTASTYASKIQPGQKIVDLSADFRFDTTGEWVYGLPERKGKRDLIAKAGKVSNPGCYATACQLAIFPLLDEGLIAGTPSLFGVSGYSGAGTTPSPKNDISRLRDNMMPYSLVDHIHEQEVSAQIGRNVNFAPHVASWFRGINITASIHLNRNLSKKDISDLYSEYYRNEPLVKVIDAIPEVRDIAGRHGAVLGGFSVPKSKDGQSRVVLVSTVDNLLKGAATQCLQNMNLIAGVDEFSGVPVHTDKSQ